MLNAYFPQLKPILRIMQVFYWEKRESLIHVISAYSLLAKNCARTGNLLILSFSHAR